MFCETRKRGSVRPLDTVPRRTGSAAYGTLVTPPKHGTVRFVTTDVGVPRGSGCNNSVNGQAVMYRPDPGFVGKDRFTYNSPTEEMAFDVVGHPGLKTVIVTVVNKS